MCTPIVSGVHIAGVDYYSSSQVPRIKMAALFQGIARKVSVQFKDRRKGKEPRMAVSVSFRVPG